MQARIPAEGCAITGEPEQQRFWSGFWWTFSPILLFSLLSSGGLLAGGSSPNDFTFIMAYLGFLWYLGPIVWAGAVCVVLCALFTGWSATKTGILAVLGVGFLSLGVSCFANLNLMD